MPINQRFRSEIFCALFAILALSSNVFASPLTRQSASNQASEDDDVFENLEPGVRLIGKPDPSVILGQVLAFKPVVDTDNLVVVCEDGMKLWDAKRKKILKAIKFDKKTTGCRASKVSNSKDLFAFSFWDVQSENQTQKGVVWIVDKELKKHAEFLFENEVPQDQNPSVVNSVSAIGFSADDSHIALGTGKALYWCNVDTGEFVKTFKLGEYKSIFNLIVDDDRIYALGYNSYQIDLNDGTVSSLPESLKVLNGTRSSHYHKGSRRVFALKERDSKIVIFDLDDDSYEELEFEAGTRMMTFGVSNDGSRLAVFSFLPNDESTFQIGVYDTQTRELKHRFPLSVILPNLLEFTDGDNELTLGVRYDAGVQTVKINSDVVEQEVSITPTLKLNHILLSNDGKEFVGSRLASTALKWDWDSGRAERFKEYVNYLFPTHAADTFFYMNQSGVQFSFKKSKWAKLKSVNIKSYAIRQPLLMPALGYLSGFGKQERDTAAYYVLPSSLAVNETNTKVHCVVIDTLDGIRIETIKLSNNKLVDKSLFRRPKIPNLNMLPTTAITNDGKRFAIYESEKVRIFDVESKELVFEKKFAKSEGLYFSQKREWLAVHSSKGVKILDSESGEVIKDIAEPDALVAYAFNADRLLVASKKADKPVRIFNTQTWEIELQHNTDTGDRTAVSISNDGRRAAFALLNCRIELWELEELER